MTDPDATNRVDAIAAPRGDFSPWASVWRLPVASSALRTEQERVTNILDKIKNGGSFVQPSPDPCLSPSSPSRPRGSSRER